jgi:hypothetical protein
MKKYDTPKQLADLEEKRTLLMRRINQWREVQLAYIPAIGSLVAHSASELFSLVQSGDTQSLVSAEAIPLFLPSSLSSNLQNTPGFAEALARELRLRTAQADDALADIRHHLRIISGLWQFKKLSISGTGNNANTRMRTLFNRFNHRMQCCVKRYRAAHATLLAADPGGSWVDRLQDLKDADVRGPGKDDFTSSNGRFEQSWIWLVPHARSEAEADSSEEVADEGMRVEWAKSLARKNRWEEEVLITEEEMRRVVCYYEWKESWWLKQLEGHTAGRDSIQHGIGAYAHKQAYLCKCLAKSFAMAWLPFLQSKGVVPDWKSRYDQLVPNIQEPRTSSAPGHDLTDQDNELDGKEVIDDQFDEEVDEEEQYLEHASFDTFGLDD